MGNLASLMQSFAHIKVTPNCDSIYCPGKKSAISDPILKWQYTDFEEFWEEVVAHSRTPIQLSEYPLVKDFEYRELGPNSTETKVTLDGRWLKLLGRQEDERDAVAAWFRVHVDPEERIIRNEDLGQGGELQRWLCCVFHHDEEEGSFRLESWIELLDGTHDAGAEFAQFVEHLQLKPHLAMRHMGRKVDCKGLQPAPDDPGRRIVLSQDLSGFFEDPAALLEGLLALMKQEVLDLHGTVEYGETEREVVLDSVVPLGPDSSVAAIRYVSTNPETCEMRVQVHIKTPRAHEPVFFITQFWKIYSDPVRLGYWNKRPDGESLCGNYYDTLEPALKLNRLVNERDVIKEVEGLDENNFFL